MESILVWTLAIAALAIISMLVLLIASEREVIRKRLEVESLRMKLERGATMAEASGNQLHDGGTEVSAEVAALTEQVRSNEVAIATMQCELEALRAENSWLKQGAASYQSKEPGSGSQPAESLSSPRGERSAARAADHRLSLSPRKSRLIFPAAAVVLLLVAWVSVYFARGWHATASKPAQQVEFRGEGQSQESLVTASVLNADADYNHRMSDENPPPKASPSKKGAPAGASYEVVRSTRVFSQPNESSRPLARIEVGMEIHVVGARDDWLEVRSRHGRPSGFIKKDAVVLK
jgi:hypothetical protein